ncbi:hypothetical protein [Adhaeribacter aquaticus]|uniref:hypothetical protein n=1 Tax=Adhaeribacter aquaticus TaxID=299567 RepID=UPI00047A8229|nr:hypothetical protein [Adhaeribacter aquaticus]
MKIKLTLELVGRYILGLIMIAYGLIKIIDIQFRLAPLVYDIPLGSLDGVTLTWAFFGYKTWFTILLGLIEFVSGTLLLFTRTKLIGKILTLPILIGIALVNNAFDFLPYMKVFTGCLLLLNILLLGMHTTIFKIIIKQVICGHSKYPQAEVLINITLVSIITFLVIYHLL